MGSGTILAKRLRDLREADNLKQKELGEMLSLKASAISKYEAGDTQPSLSTLVRLAEIFAVSTDYLLGVSNIKNPYASESFSAEETEMVHKFRRLNPENRVHLDERIEMIYEQQEEGYHYQNKP